MPAIFSGLNRFSAALVVLWLLCGGAVAQTIPTVTLQADKTTANAGDVVIFTATVTSDGSKLPRGIVRLCEASPIAKTCEGFRKFGEMPVVASGPAQGTATFRLRPPPAMKHQYKAELLPMPNGNPAYGSATSPTISVTVGGHKTITTLDKPSGTVGDYTLTAHVTGFGTQAFIGGSVSFLDASNGDAELKSADVLGSTASLTFPSAPAPQSWPTSESGIVADIKEDGFPDLVSDMIGSDTTGTANFLINDGQGNFSYSSFPTPAPDSTDYANMVIGDFDADGHVDYINWQLNYGGANTVEVLLYLWKGNGDGTFGTNPIESKITVYLPGNYLGASPYRHIDSGDLNNDGVLDVFLSLQAYKTDQTIIKFYTFTGSGNGTFTEGQSIVTSFNTQPYRDPISRCQVVLNDFNNDGNLDFLLAGFSSLSRASNSEPPDLLFFYPGNGIGGFNPFTTIKPSPEYIGRCLHSDDFDDDGKLDVATGAGKALFLLKGNGGGGFSQVGDPLPLSITPYHVKVGDFNGDNQRDFIVSNNNQADIGLGTSAWQFDQQTVPVGSAGGYVWVADYNGDGASDFVTGIIIWSWGGTGSVQLTRAVVEGEASAGDVYVPGTGTHEVEARYDGTRQYAGSISSTQPLTAGRSGPSQ
ncbi:FG-GAP-like repeat-containing protein [Phyllobacterium leguminum]|uniref:VCBS repeat protein n=1 Tax=Phyllobacterium leguminum TaxID=314237 RepID=A0A318T4L7_9HYPH|nr:FG-GAP-like repeat-containing protein [Phyllobacterium leguminum]PYE89742.1 VCBS repeat protein [Phyllobacterium leguminum]